MVGNPAILTGLKRGSRFGEQNHQPPLRQAFGFGKLRAFGFGKFRAFGDRPRATGYRFDPRKPAPPNPPKSHRITARVRCRW